MKNAFLSVIIITAFCLVFLLNGCNNNSPQTSSSGISDSSSANSSAASSPVSVDTGNDDIFNPENQPELFLKALKEKDLEKITMMTGIDNKAVKVYNNIDIDKYEYSLEKTDDYFNIYNVVLNVSESGLAEFPEGENTYLLKIRKNYSSDYNFEDYLIVYSFHLKSKKIDFPVYQYQDMPLFISAYFTTINDWFETAEELYVKNEIGFIEMCTSFISYDYETGFTNEELNEVSQKLFGISGLDAGKYKMFHLSEEVKDRFVIRGHGGFYYIYNVKEKEKNETVETVTVEYFADFSYTIVAKTMKYTLEKNSDDSYRLTRTELVYDSGYDYKTYSN